MPGLLDRIGGAIFPSQQPMDGLITAEDIANARKSGLLGLGAGLLAASGPSTQRSTMLQAVGQGLQGAQQSYQGSLDTSMQRQGSALRIGQMRAEQQAQQARVAARAAILRDHPAPDGTNPDDLRKWIDATLPLWLQSDPETAKSLSEVRKSIQEPTPPSLDMAHQISGSDPRLRALGVDPSKSYTVQLDRQGRIVGQPLAEGASANALMRFGEMTPAAQQTVITATQNAFDRETKDYAKAAEAFSQVNAVLQRARSNTHSPDDIVQLIDGVSRLNNPGAIVRAGTVNIQLQKIGSYADKLRMWVAQGGRGTWPTDIIDGIARAARTIAQEHRKQYNDIRQRAITRGTRAGVPYLDTVLPNVWDNTEGVDDNTPPLTNYNFGGRP